MRKVYVKCRVCGIRKRVEERCLDCSRCLPSCNGLKGRCPHCKRPMERCTPQIGGGRHAE